MGTEQLQDGRMMDNFNPLAHLQLYLRARKNPGPGCHSIPGMALFVLTVLHFTTLVVRILVHTPGNQNPPEHPTPGHLYPILPT